MHAREEAVSEIVGALLLVVIVSSAAFGFGLFVHQQQKETQAQQAAELAVRLEKIVAQGVVPGNLMGECGGGGATPDGTWDTLNFTLTNRHLHDSTLTAVTLNKLAVKALTVTLSNGTEVPVDFTLQPTDTGYQALAIPAGRSVVLHLSHLNCTASSPFFNPPADGIPVDLPLQLEVVTGLGNHVERVFIPPVAQASIEPVAGVNGTFILVGTDSQPGSQDASIVRWVWDLSGGPDCASWARVAGFPKAGHRLQVTGLAAGQGYCARLTVTDNNGLSGQADLAFTA